MGVWSQDGLTPEARGLWSKAEVLRLWGVTDWYISEQNTLEGRGQKLLAFHFPQVTG